MLVKLNQKNLKPHVLEWQKKNLIGPDQAEAILQLYPASGRNLWMIAFAVLGSLLCLGGVSLIIASNWKDIPDSVKFGGLLALLAGSTALGIESQHREAPRAWAESGFLAATIFPLLGLMLISQIFHIEGKPSGLFIAWALGIALVPFLSRTVSSFVVFLAAVMLALGARLDEWMERGGGQFFVMCWVFAGFGVACALLSQLWLLAGERTMRVVGEFWGLATVFVAIYLLGFDIDRWFVCWALLFLACLGLIWRGYSAERIHQVNLGFVMAGIVIISVFLRLVGTMRDTGLIFLLGGIGLLGFTIGWNMIRLRILKALQ
ncbi:MAG TPA: DUF2157 domain-containing protein [Chthoniobacterales bacterium]